MGRTTQPIWAERPRETVDGGPGMRQTVAMTVSVLVCDSDELARRALGRVVVERGLELVAEATTAVEAVTLREALGATVVVLGNELQGMAGLEVVPELAESGARVILISNDPDALARARQAGAFYAVERGDLDNFVRAIDALGEANDPDERRTGIDRRSGADRRQHEDWGKVIRERRTGADRRVSDRRQQGTAPSAVSA
jgi:chemotaxis response regulator CheB